MQTLNIGVAATGRSIPFKMTLMSEPCAYRVEATDNRMSPRYCAGDTLYVHPYESISPGDYVVLVRKANDREKPPVTIVGRLVGKSESEVVLEQLNPSKIVTVPGEKVLTLHMVVGSSNPH